MRKTFGVQNCCGCEACVQACPKHCITMTMNSEGFYYPQVDVKKCVTCRSCVNVCPTLKKMTDRIPLKAYGAINENEQIRLNSSSGGLFTLLAIEIIKRGGCVFGARFDEKWNVIHDYVLKIEDLDKFRGSKYVQSSIGTAYKDSKKFLDSGRLVLFSGTPCQISGLQGFLKREYDNLLLIDFVCHGVPSPGVWQWYLEREKQVVRKQLVKFSLISFLFPNPFITKCEFRNKENGWSRYHFVLSFAQVLIRDRKNVSISSVHYENPYMRLFLRNLILRSSCYKCLMKRGHSHSDITLADFWNVHRVIQCKDDDKGTSLVLLNTEKGQKLFETIKCKKVEVDFEQAIQYNKAWSESYEMNPNRGVFFRNYKKHLDDFDVYVDSIPPTYIDRIKSFFKNHCHMTKD